MTPILETAAGGWVDFSNPFRSNVEPEDVAQGLAYEYRYGNQLEDPRYSVLQHSLMCYHLSRVKYPHSIKLQIICLLHDASEAFMHDLPAQLKQFCTEYKKIEKKVQAMLYSKIGGIDYVGDIYTSLMHELDSEALHIELYALGKKEAMKDNLPLHEKAIYQYVRSLNEEEQQIEFLDELRKLRRLLHNDS